MTGHLSITNKSTKHKLNQRNRSINKRIGIIHIHHHITINIWQQCRAFLHQRGCACEMRSLGDVNYKIPDFNNCNQGFKLSLILNYDGEIGHYSPFFFINNCQCQNQKKNSLYGVNKRLLKNFMNKVYCSPQIGVRGT
jgi:hypothetical protein